MHSRYLGDRGPTLGQHLIDHGFYSARVGKIFHMRVPGDIIDGTDGNDVPETWTEQKGKAGTTSENSGIAQYPDNIRKMWADYYATVTFLDEQLGKIMAELDRLGLRDSTLVIFTSDHGYHLGEHHFWQKSKFHEEVTRVPMLISAPGYETGRTLALAELMDIYPTVCDLVGVPIPQTVQGKSLRPVLRDTDAAVREAAFAVDRRKGHFLRTADRAYMLYSDGTAELYDMDADPGQFTNLSGSPDHAEIEAELKAKLEVKAKAAAR